MFCLSEKSVPFVVKNVNGFGSVQDVVAVFDDFVDTDERGVSVVH